MPSARTLRLATVTSLALLIPLLAGCSSSDDTDGGNPPSLGTDDARTTGQLERVLGDPRTSGLDEWPGTFRAPVGSYDFDGDGTDEIFSQSEDTKVYVFSADGRALAVLPTKTPPGWHIQEVLNGVEAAVMAPGESASLIVTSHAGYLTRWQFDPVTSTHEKFTFTKAWEKRMDMCHKSPGMDAKPTLADLDGGGDLEILTQTEEVGFYAHKADGTLLWKQCWGGGNSAPVAADLDGDGDIEAIIGSDAGFVAVIDGKTGDPMWTFDAANPSYGISPASITVSPAIGDLDGQLPLEIVFTARHAPRDMPAAFPAFHMAIFAIHQNPDTYEAEIMWVRQPEWANPLSATQLIIYDVDNDGASDIFGLDWNTVGHNPGDWERLGPANAFRLTAEGEDVWVRELDSWWSNHAVALGDVDGDGQMDLLANGPRDGYDGVWSIDSVSGEAQQFIPASEWKLMRGPLLMDLHHDGQTFLAYPAQPADGSPRGAILLYDLDVRHNVAWRGTS